MKGISIFLGLMFFTFSTLLSAQGEVDSTGFDGDHFSLEGALHLLKQSENPEDFEKRINEENNYVNNLDLNQDGEIDYVKVLDNANKDTHAMILQVDINEFESQDVAVILIEKKGEDNAVLQIIGDENVYGEEKIVEPYMESIDSGGKGNSNFEYGNTRIVVNVWTWPSVQYVYAPTYRVYRSPWKWQVYPQWWKPWRPHPWNWHYSKRKVYHIHYKPYHSFRVVRAHNYYKPKRKSSLTVKSRTIQSKTRVTKKGRVKSVKVTDRKVTKSGGMKKREKSKVTKAKRTKKTQKVKGDKKRKAKVVKKRKK